MEQIDRRRFLQRAGLGAGAAGALWVAPSVLGYDAAFAGNSCVVQDTLAWGTQWPGGAAVSTGAGGINFAATGGKPLVNLKLTVGNAAGGAPGTPDPTNLHSSRFTPNTNAGDTNDPRELGGIANNSWLNMQFATGGTFRGYLLTFTFAPAVYNLRFNLYDVDQYTGGGTANYRDSIAINATPASFTANTPANISGNGSNATPFLGVENTNTGLVTNTSMAGNIAVVVAGPITTLTITYVGTLNSTSNQVVGIGDMTWCR
jgi:hypothetical protein